MARYMQMYHELGYNVLASDDRGAGTSEGNYIGFGWPDRLDYVKWIDKVIEYNGLQSQIALFGVRQSCLLQEKNSLFKSKQLLRIVDTAVFLLNSLTN
ncbi:hypothetical protein MQC79_04715 [Lactococcus garvieae]|uniref:alpha/beta hydrolase n=1 Tax=Lactococcus garvieae TaxID=1363 RepID=UPI001F60C14A|nr:hypothetical protein [Lactococcus garvieae]MCI3860385.1 hypothetical protein [Lactococcus garvieae]